MKNQVHILNGDALREQFPESLSGEILVARECMIEGNVKGKTLNEIFANRAEFMNHSYEVTKEQYDADVKREFLKMTEISPDSEINLWFEDDLFCQANFYFVVHLLNQSNLNKNLFLVRPKEHTRYGFGNYDGFGLQQLYESRVPIVQLEKVSKLWLAYQANDHEGLLELARGLKASHPFIIDGVEAHINRFPKNDLPGRPIQALLEIMEDLQSDNFSLIFQEFCKREPIYGFGDSQVKRLFDEIMKGKSSQG